LDDAPPPIAQGFNEGKGKPFTEEDIRYTSKDGVLYAFVMARPKGKVTLTSLAANAKLLDGAVAGVEQLGRGEVAWTLNDFGLSITPDADEIIAADLPVVFRISTTVADPSHP
jgi:alpha-L-fucosidase